MGNVRYGKSLVGEKSGRGKVCRGKVGMGNGLWEKSVGEKSVWESSPNHLNCPFEVENQVLQ